MADSDARAKPKHRTRPLIGRLTFGVLFVVLGLAGAITDLAAIDVGPSFGIATLIGAATLLAALLLPRRRWPTEESTTSTTSAPVVPDLGP